MQPTEVTIADGNGFNKAQVAADAELELQRFTYLVEQRDSLLDKIRFGSLQINGASLLALLASLGGDGYGAKWIGFTQGTARVSAMLFVAGAIAAGVSIVVEATLLRNQAGDASTRRGAAQLLKSGLEMPSTTENLGKVRDLMKAYHDAPQVDFQYSAVGIAAQSLSGGLWLAGVAIPLLNALGFS